MEISSLTAIELNRSKKVDKCRNKSEKYQLSYLTMRIMFLIQNVLKIIFNTSEN